MKFSQTKFDSIKAMQGYQILRQSGMILLAICMTKGLLPQEEIGYWELLTFIGFSTTFFWVDGLIKTFVSERKSGQINATLIQYYGLFLWFGLGVTLLLILGQNSFVPYLLGQPKIPYLFLFGIYLILYLPTSLLPAYYLLNDRSMAIISLGFLLFIGPSLCLLMTVGLGFSITYFYVAMILFACCIHLIILIEIINEKSWNFQFAKSRKIIFLAWPLMVYAVATSMAKVFDGWLVSWYYKSENIFAIFRFGAREFPLAVALTAGMTLAFIPLINNNKMDAFAEIKKRSTNILHFLTPITIILFFISPFCFEFFFNENFRESAFIFNVYLLLIISQILFPHAILLAFQKNKIILLTAIVELSLNVILSFIFIRYWGLIGVALATVIAFCVEKIIYIFYLKVKEGIQPRTYIPIKIYTVYFVLIVGAFILSIWYGN